MINKDRIVPIQKIDFLSMIALVLKIAGVSFDVLKAADVEGHFTVAGDSNAGNLLADQPVKGLDFGEATAGVVYFVADYGFEGFKIGGAAAEFDGEIKADGITLYTATLASGAITVAAV